MKQEVNTGRLYGDISEQATRSDRITPQTVLRLIQTTPNPEQDILEAAFNMSNENVQYTPEYAAKTAAEEYRNKLVWQNTTLFATHFDGKVYPIDPDEIACSMCPEHVMQGKLLIQAVRDPEDIKIETDNEGGVSADSFSAGPRLSIPYIDIHSMDQHGSFALTHNGRGHVTHISPNSVSRWQQEVEDYMSDIPGKPIGVSKTSNIVQRAVTEHVFGDKDLYRKYEIPPVVNDVFPVADGARILIRGPQKKLQFTLETAEGRINLNQVAPMGTSFIFNEYSREVHTNVYQKEIQVPIATSNRPLLPYSLLHAIARLELYEDPNWKEYTKDAYSVLGENGRIVYVQAYGQVELPKDPIQREKEIVAWEIVAEEEKKIAELALGYLRDIRSQGINPLPQIKSAKDLAKIINSWHISRTNGQYIFTPNNVYKYTGVTMEIPQSRIREITGEFYK